MQASKSLTVCRLPNSRWQAYHNLHSFLWGGDSGCRPKRTTMIPIIHVKKRNLLPERRDIYDYKKGYAAAIVVYKAQYGIEPDKVYLYDNGYNYKFYAIEKPTEAQNDDTN